MSELRVRLPASPHPLLLEQAVVNRFLVTEQTMDHDVVQGEDPPVRR